MKQVVTKYDVALSFAGEDRQYVEAVAARLQADGVHVFYDRYEQVELWGKDLYQHLSEVYQTHARFTVIFVSKHYAAKLWTRHELKAAQARAFQENEEYVLPARFDSTELPGLLPTVGYMNLEQTTPDELATAICKKIVQGGGKISPEPEGPLVTGVRKTSPGEFKIALRDSMDKQIVNATIKVIYPNKTSVQNNTNAVDGTAEFQLHERSLVTLFCAHPAHPGFLREDFDPIENITIRLPSVHGTGSLVCMRPAHIPGLTGRLHPIRDTHDRLYLYADNIAVDDGKAQPVTFALNQWLHLEDAHGKTCFLRIRAILGNNSLLEYRFRPLV